MATRYSGSLSIRIRYTDAGDYRGTITTADGKRWRFSDLHAPACGFGAGVAYDSPRAYDEMAASAISFGGYYTSDNRPAPGEDDASDPYVPSWAPSADVADDICNEHDQDPDSGEPLVYRKRGAACGDCALPPTTCPGCERITTLGDRCDVCGQHPYVADDGAVPMDHD